MAFCLPADVGLSRIEMQGQGTVLLVEILFRGRGQPRTWRDPAGCWASLVAALDWRTRGSSGRYPSHILLGEMQHIGCALLWTQALGSGDRLFAIAGVLSRIRTQKQGAGVSCRCVPEKPNRLEKDLS